MVTFTSTLITQQPARHCSASPIAYRMLKRQHQNITSIQKFYQTTTRARILTLFLPLLGPFPLKGTTQKKHKQHTKFFFSSFLIFPVTQLPATFFVHTHNILTLCLGADAQLSFLAPFFWVVEIPPLPQEMVEVPPPPQGMI